jgi:hypothetical protein
MKRVTVIYHWEDTGWWAECGEMPGWSAAAPDRDNVRRLAHEAVAMEFGGHTTTISAFLVDKVYEPGLRVDPAGTEVLEVRA